MNRRTFFAAIAACFIPFKKRTLWRGHVDENYYKGNIARDYRKWKRPTGFDSIDPIPQVVPIRGYKATFANGEWTFPDEETRQHFAERERIFGPLPIPA